MNGFQAFIDFAEGTASIKGGRGVREPHLSGLILATDARLDNRKELLDTLAADLPGTPEDADLILAAYLKWGESCPERLLGDFAFVVWDPRNRRLFAARDQLGVRPLHYTRVGSLLGVASNVRSLLQHTAVPRRVDLVAVGDYLAHVTSEPDRTFFQDVHCLPSAHTLTAIPGGIRVQRYWDVKNLEPLNVSAADAASRFLELLQQAVRDRIDYSAGSTGIAMSGGLDSTSVAAITAQELARRGTGPLSAYSFVFGQLRECDERGPITAFSKALGIETSFIDAENFWILGDQAAYVPPLETPATSWESAFRQMMQTLQQRGGRVLLTGHGADDLLLGSRFVYADRLRRGDLRVFGEIWQHSRSRRYGWRPFYRLLVEPQLSPGLTAALRSRFSHRGPKQVPAWIDADFARQIGLAERLAETENGTTERTALGQMHARLVSRPSYHRSLEWYDRNSQSFGIEVRHPFLDRRLFEFIFSLRPDHLFRLGERKYILRQALAGILPDLVRLRRKTSLGSFVDFSLKKEADRVRKVLATSWAVKLGIINGEAVRQAFEHYCVDKPDTNQRSLWCAIALELWLRHHLHTFDMAPFQLMASGRKVA
jgi:asparagine synthase (glutamine-hydrolysing)